MKAGILSIGTELLLGDTVNTNATYLAKELSLLGIFSYRQEVVGDNPERIKQAIASLLEEVDLLITTGGLGPTSDDVTRETIAELYNRPLHIHQPSLESMQRIFNKMKREMPEINKKQAMLPEGASFFENERGTAPGVVLETDDYKIIILLPGPPREMQPMFDEKVKPYLATKTDIRLTSDTVHLFGIGESNAEAMLAPEMLLQNNPTIAPYAKEGEVIFRVTSTAPTNEEGQLLNKKTVETLSNLYAPYLFGINMGTITDELSHVMRKQRATLSILDIGLYGGFSAFVTEDTTISQQIEAVDIIIEDSLNSVKRDDIEQYMAARIKQMLVREQTTHGIMIYVYTGISTDQALFGDVYVAIADTMQETVTYSNLDRGYKDDVQRIKKAAIMKAAYDLYYFLNKNRG